MKEKRSKIREKLSLRAVGLILAMSMVAGTLLPVGVGAEELPIDINNEEITVADVMMYEDTDMSEDEEENEAAAETEEVIGVVSEENSEEAPVETSEPEAAEPETTESEVSESEVSEPEVTEPVETEPETTEPEETEPEVPDFEETEPDEIITEEELPADAPEEEIYFCGIEEHEHTEECRNAPEEPDGEIIVEEEIPEEEPQPEEEPGELYCGYEVHVHDDTCWNEEYLADCGMEEHEHSENCYSLAYTLMAEFAAAVELFPDEADYILLDFDEADGSELLDEEAYYRAYAAFYEENPDIWATTDALYNEASEAFAAENPEGDFDAWMQENGFWEAAEKFYQSVPTPETVAEITAQYEVVEEVELEFTAEQEGMMLYGDMSGNTVSLDSSDSPKGVSVKVYNYDNKINSHLLGKKDETSYYYKFFHGTYGEQEPQNSAVDGKENITHTYTALSPVEMKDSLVNQYPSTTVGSLQYLFDGTEKRADNTSTLKGTMSDGGGLFQKDEKGFYYYDSGQNAAYFNGSGFELYNFVVRPNYTDEAYNNKPNDIQMGNFLPFNNVKNVNQNNQCAKTSEGKDAYELIDKVDLWFGMMIEFEFIMPENGKVQYFDQVTQEWVETDMEFDFHGDDDVFVYIDDKLVLDIGGTHGSYSGKINFATGKVVDRPDNSTARTRTLAEIFNKTGKTAVIGKDAEGNDITSLKEYHTYKLKFFYLERGGNISYCRLRFNMPTLPENSLTVTKKVETTVTGGASEEDVTYIKNLPYMFKVLRADNDEDNDELYIPAGTKYNVLKDGVATGKTGTVNEDGYFYLQDGESAQFENMIAIGRDIHSDYYDYYVQEFIPDNLTGQYHGVEYSSTGGDHKFEMDDGTLVGEFKTYKSPELDARATQAVTYQNKINIDTLSKLKITKEIAPGSDFGEDLTFKFEVKLGGELLKNAEFTIENGFEGRTTESTDENGILTLYAVKQSDGTYIGETATLVEGIVSGTTYDVSEKITHDNNLVFYDVDEEETVPDGEKPDKTNRDTVDVKEHGVSGQFALASTVTVKATNSTYNVNDTVDLILTKMVTGNMGDRSKEFTFTVEMKLPNQPDPAAVFLSEAPTLYSVGSADDLPIIKDTNDIGSADKHTISDIKLKHGESYRIVGITKGATITISEDTAGYELKSVVYEGEGDAIKIAEGTYSVIVNDRDTEVIFTNDKTATIDTAVTLDYLPYILILTAVIPTMTLAVSRKRRRRED